jgi:S-adenosylmethionine:tRNA-ribosyltransferase-isomerase (queuine synthetase)
MSEADKMFYNIGFEKKIEDEKQVEYRDIEDKDLYITIYKKDKEVIGIPNYRYSFTISILQAINQKCRELKWYE